MKLLFFGDVVGRSGREVVVSHTPQLRKDLNIDFVIANGENAAGGFGITKKICGEFFDAGVDVITLGIVNTPPRRWSFVLTRRK